MILIELRKELRDLCEKEGSALSWAKRHKISHTYVSAVLRGSAKPGKKILKALGEDKGWKMRVEYKYQDITN